MLTRMRSGLWRLMYLALWLALVISAAKMTHDFYRYVDRSIYVAVDDSEANIAYDLATYGRYGFPASPVLADMSRLDGQFNYGPWYFYLAGGLVWLFGFSLTLVRSIHLWVLLATIGVAGAWFSGRDRATVAVLYGLGMLYAFEASQWPMARPDILVSGFALAFVVCAGLGALRSRPVYWFGAGLAATCGAFTHLIAASLIPSAVLVLAVVAWGDLRESTDRPSTWRYLWRASLALILGIALGLAMFYASFGFDFGTQWQFLTAYRDLTKRSDTFLVAIGHHLNYAFVYLSPGMRYVVGAVFAASWVLAGVGERMNAPERRVVRASMLPPLVAWTGYTLTGGGYTSYHSGYAVLHQVLFVWTAATLLWLTLWLARQWNPRIGSVVGVVALVLVTAQAGRQLAWQLSADSWRIRRIDTWVSFSEYAAKVIEPLPDGATAWGSVIFGLQAPDRIQMINWVDAMALLSRVPESRRESLSPDYVVLGYPELRDNMLMTTRGPEGLLAKTQKFIPGHNLRLVSLVAATPYGVSRTYARHAGNVDPDRAVPHVSVYVPGRQQWLHRVGPPSPAEFKEVAPVVLRVGYEAEPPETRPSITLAGELPPGPYLLRVSVVPGAGDTERRMITATSSSMLVQTMSELGPEGDFAPYLAGDTLVFLLADHNGGPLSVSQFDNGAAPRIAAVTAYPVVGLLERDELPSRALPLPSLEKWEATTGNQARVEGNELVVTGDGSGSGYQLMSPFVRVRESHEVTIRISMRTLSGRVCTGILNGDGRQWLVTPDRTRGELQFTVDETQAFRVVYANCNPREGSPPSRFAVSPGEILDQPPAATYARRLVVAALHPELEQLDERAGPDVQTVPAGLVVSAAAVSGPIEPVTPEELGYRAGIVTHDAGVWSFQGQAEGAYTYLVQTRERRLDADSRLLVSGHVTKGGIAIGLLRDNKWVSQINVTEAGEFTVVIAPPGRGAYSILVANVLPQGLDTSIVLNKFGLVAKPGPAGR